MNVVNGHARAPQNVTCVTCHVSYAAARRRRGSPAPAGLHGGGGHAPRPRGAAVEGHVALRVWRVGAVHSCLRMTKHGTPCTEQCTCDRLPYLGPISTCTRGLHTQVLARSPAVMYVAVLYGTGTQGHAWGVLQRRTPYGTCPAASPALGRCTVYCPLTPYMMCP